MELKKVNKGEILSMTNYMVVTGVNVKANTISVKDMNGMEFDIQGKSLIESGKIKSAAQYTSSVRVSRTELIEKLRTSNGVVLTVNFDKADSTNRTMICYYLNAEPGLGRSQVKDLEDPSKPFKQVDHRTLQWIIINNVKYQVK